MDTLLKDGRFRPISWGNGKPGPEKAQALGWNTEFGKHGRLTQIDKHSLRLDNSYQRRQSTEKARRIASEFDWTVFGVVVVSERPNGEYFVLDGGHRVLGTMMRPEVSNVPCYVFSGLSKEDEAEAFVRFNAYRKPPTGLELFAAQIMAGDNSATSVARILRAYGSSVGYDTNACRCPRKLIGLYASLGEARFRALVKLATMAWPKAPDGERLSDQVVSGLAGFGKALESVGLSLESPAVVAAVSKMSLPELKRRTIGVQSTLQKKRGEAFKYALCEFWNKGRRVKRLPLHVCLSA